VNILSCPQAISIQFFSRSMTCHDICGEIRHSHLLDRCRKRARARMNTQPDVQGSVAELIVEREGLDVIAGCKVVEGTCSWAIMRMRNV
jgi:hypothetical protein